MRKITARQTEPQDQSRRCLNAALRYLSYRPRGEAELRTRLTQRGFSKEVQNAVVAHLKEDGLLNDAIFAQFWKDARDYFHPRSKWMTREELKQKGISSEIIEQVVSTIDDADNAYRAAMEKSRRLSGADYEIFCRKIGSHLQRRGFSSGVIKHAVNKVWEDRNASSDSMSEPCPR